MNEDDRAPRIPRRRRKNAAPSASRPSASERPRGESMRCRRFSRVCPTMSRPRSSSSFILTPSTKANCRTSLRLERACLWLRCPDASLSSRAMSTLSRLTGNFWSPISISRSPSSTNRVGSARRSISFSARSRRNEATTSRSSFRERVRTGRSASKRSRKPEASFWFRTRTRPNMGRCLAARSRPASPISSCPCGRSPGGFPS